MLVTGATGFVGGRVAERLASEEGAVVTGTGRDLDKARRLEGAGVELVAADLAVSGGAAALLEGRDLVAHFAAYAGPDAEAAEAVNVEATARLVRRAAGAGVGRFLHVSSVAVYGVPDRMEVTEEAPLSVDDADLYIRTKARGELRAREVAEVTGMELVVVRPGQVYGPRSDAWTVGLYRAVAEGRAILVGDGSGHFHPVHVDNLVDALLLAATSPAAPGEAFNVVEPPVPWRDFVRPYAELAGREPRAMPAWLAGFFAADRVAIVAGRHAYSSEKARRVLGWTLRLGPEAAMEDAVAWLRESGPD